MRQHPLSQFKPARDWRPLWVMMALGVIVWLQDDDWFTSTPYDSNADRVMSWALVTLFLGGPASIALVRLWDEVTHAKRKIPAKDRALYEQYIRSPEWRKLADQIRSYQSNICADCGTTGALEVHHITYKHLFDEESDDLIGLCKKCHEARHGM